MLNKIKNSIKGCIDELTSFAADKNTAACFMSSVFFGLLSYIYLFTNNLNIFDNIAMTPWGYGVGTTSGRWFLQEFGDYVGKVWGNYNIPVFIVLFSIAALALSSCFLVRIFNIKNKWNAVLIGGITVVFPAVASAMLFTFTMGYYALAILFVTAGIYFIKKFNIPGFIAGALLFSFSLGIYQGYYPYAATIFVIMLIQMCTEEEVKFKDVLLKGIKYLSALAAGYVLYRLFLQYFLHVNNISLSSYEGIDEMGKIDLSLLPAQIKSIYKTMLKMPFENYMAVNGTRIIRYSFVWTYVLGLANYIIIMKDMIKKKNFLVLAMLGVLTVMFPIAVDSIVILVPNGRIYTLMQMAFVSIFYLLIAVTDHNKSKRPESYVSRVLSFASSAIILVSIFNYSWQSNVNYKATYYENRMLENYYQTMYTRIKATEGYNQDMDVYFVGHVIEDKTFSSNWEGLPFRYGGNRSHLNTYSYSRYKTILNYLGYDYNSINKEDELYLKNKDEIEEMERYPNSGSIKVIDGAMFIRLE